MAILDFRFWILDFGTTFQFVLQIQNQKSKIKNEIDTIRER